jgi:dTDP-4-dehydrorhamnose 3,5-epimerase-like enzyme
VENKRETFILNRSSEDRANTKGASKIRGVRTYSLTSHSDSRGSLTAGEFPTSLPFEVKRFFFISQVPVGSVRGEHAHLKCEQFLVAIKGSVRVLLEASGQSEKYILNTSDLGLFIPPMTWGVQYEYSEDCALLVLASHEFDKEDYITNYESFLKLQKSL